MRDAYFERKLRNIKLNDLGLDSRLPEYLCKELENRFDKLEISSNERQKQKKYLNVLASKDVDTAKHCIRVALLSERIAREANLDAKALLKSGNLHDVGKALLPFRVLNNSNFGDKQMRFIKKHPLLTFKLLKDECPFTAIVCVKHHRYQPNGYPETLPEIGVPFSNETIKKAECYSKISSVADFFDAAVSRNNNCNKFIRDGSKDIESIIKTIEDRKIIDQEFLDNLKNADIFYEHLKLVDDYAKVKVCK